jgi:hypothetical protein
MKRPSAGTLAVLAPSVAFAQFCSPYWTGVGSPVRPLVGNAMIVFDDGAGPQLYVSGRLHAGPDQLGVARWDGRSWHVINQGLSPLEHVWGLRLLYDGEAYRLYVNAQKVGAPDPLNVWWNGSEWMPPPKGFIVNPTTGPRYSYFDGHEWRTYGLELVAPGFYCVVKWTGGQWVRLPGQFMGQPARFAAYDDGSGLKLHIAGPFTQIDNIPINRAARWTGSTWEPLGAGTSTSPTDMIVHDDGSGPALYLSNIILAGGMHVNHLARWDGHAWSDVGGSIQPVGIVTPHVLASFDDGDGPALFIGGFMSVMGGGVPVRSIARYKNGVWDNMGGGVRGGIPRTMTVFDDGRGPSLFVGGDFHTVAYGAEGSARRIAQWVGCENQCYADCDNSQISPRLNIDDFTCFINRFAAGDPYADCNQDSTRDINDFHCFITRFAEQCR